MQKKLLLVLLVVAVLTLLLAWMQKPPTPEPVSSEATPPQETKTTYQRPAVKVAITSPAGGDQWVLGDSYEIRWERAYGATGGVYLVDAATGKTTGWILAQSGPAQTMYRWDTRQVFDRRYGGVKSATPPGRYRIKIRFDEGGPEVQSGIFSLLNREQISITTHNVTLLNYTISPKTVTVKRGDKLVLSNKDQLLHRLIGTNFGPLPVVSGGTVSYDTASLVPGTYFYYDESYPAMSGTIVVQ